MKFTVRTCELTKKFQFIMHAEGCKDCAKDAVKFGGYTETAEGPDAKTAAQTWLDESGYSDTEVYESPWLLEHIDIKPCCKY